MYDLVFLHPPLSFRKLDHPLGGVFEAVTGTTDLLTMMPMGVLSLANELHRAGLETVVLNVAKRLQELRAEPTALAQIEAEIERYPARIYGIDLHWAAHASGAIDLARLCKQKHPDSFVLLGGLSATYYTDEILSSYPFVDGVVQGECDGLMADITRALISDPMQLDRAPNFAFRDGERVRKNPVVAPNLSKVDYVDTHGLVRPAPVKERFEREVLHLVLPIVRGCSLNCLFCGGSKSAYQRFFNRNSIDVLPAATVIDMVHRAADRGQGLTGIRFFGDIRLGGDAYCRELLEGVRGLGTKLDVLLEPFWPMSREFLEPWLEVAEDVYATISPESSSRDIRRAFGKGYDNDAILEQARVCKDLDIVAWYWLTYLLPEHSPDNLLREIDLIDQLLEIDPTATVLMEPYLFLDPGSPIFEQPEQYGYTIRFKTLAEIKEAMERPYWAQSIGYRTRAFTELGFHQAILDVTDRTAHTYFGCGRLAARDLLKTTKNVLCNREMGRLMAAQAAVSDADLRAAVDRVFPEYLRQSNRNLIVRPFMGEALGQRSSPEAMIYDAFPAALELLLGRTPESAAATVGAVDGWLEARGAELKRMLGACALPDQVATLMARLLEPLHLPPAFVADLLEFEWDVFRLLYFEEPRVAGSPWRERFVVKSYGHDLVCIDELASAVVEGGGAPAANPTFYVFEQEHRRVLALSFDPRDVETEIANARLREMSVLARRLVRAEKTVLRVLARVNGQPDAHKPRLLHEGPLAASDLRRLIDTWWQS